MFRTWLYFMLLTLLMLAFLWGGEILLYRTMYRKMMQNEITSATNSICDNYRGKFDDAYTGRIMSEATDLRMMVVVFTLQGADPSSATQENVQILHVCDPMEWQNREPESENRQFVLDDKFTSVVEKSGKTYSYTVHSDHIGEDIFIVCTSKVVGSETVYFYSSSVVSGFDVSTVLLTNQLISVTSICLIFAVLLALALSRNITKPLTEFAKTAKLLGKGKVVKFKRSGYDEFDALAKTLTTASEEIEKTEKLRRDFLANVSHDLRTPLTIVKAYAERVRDISYRDEQKRNEHCKVIIDEVDRLTDLVNDILELSKLQSGTVQPEKTKVDLSYIAKTVMERFSILQEQGYSLSLVYDENAIVDCDAQMIEQVMYNLVGNAVSYTGEDKTVKVTVKKEENKVIVRVTDTGKGIAPSEKDKVWDRYYRASQTKRAVKGSGIGLSIVKSLLIAHDAEYGIDSVVNNGSTFWFSLPINEEKAEEK